MMRRYPRQSVLVVLLTFLSGMAEAVGVVAILPLLGSFVGEEQSVPLVGEILSSLLDWLGLPESIGVLLVFIVILMALKGVLRIIAMREAGYAAAQVGMDLRLDLIRSLMRARWGYFTGQPVGSLANAVSSEAQRASLVFAKSVDLLARFMQVAVYTSLAFIVSWEVALFTLFSGAIMISALNFLVRITRKAGLQHTLLLKSLISRLSDGLYAIKPLKAMGKEDNLRPLLEKETRELNDTQRKRIISKATLDYSHEPIITMFVALMMYALLEVLGLPFSEVIFVAFLFYRTVTYVGSLQKHVQEFVEIQSTYWSIQGAIESAEDQEEQLQGSREVALHQKIEFDDVSFRYATQPVLSGVSFSIPTHTMTAFVGPSGSGKTTIADLLTGLYTPDSGSILVDGDDLAEADIKIWRQHIGYVPQELILFHDSIFVNVGMGDAHVSREDVEEAIRAAGAWDFVEALDEGIDSVVGEHGMRLSGGQRQRLAIARALVRKPDLLILDEATTALDPATEKAILATLAKLKDKVTIVAISHQTGLVDASDHVVRLEPSPNGAILHQEAPRIR